MVSKAAPEPAVQESVSTTRASAETPPTDTHIAIPPALAQALLKQGRVADGRVWLLLRHFDMTGRGWQTRQWAHETFTARNGPWRLFGKRQLRKLLNRGNGTFWTLSRNRIWLHGQARVAGALGVKRVGKALVSVPASTLAGSISAARAQFYAAFHAGRDSQPISRESIEDATGVSRRTQHGYETTAKIGIRPNFALLHPLDGHVQEETTWRHGRACFTLTDHKGNHGKCGKRYIARRLPNSYESTQAVFRTRGYRKLNQRLQDLPQLGTAGNSSAKSKRLYCRTVRDALRRDSNTSELYWRSTYPSIWYTMQPELSCTG